jgi:phytoene/squalene synthetase
MKLQVNVDGVVRDMTAEEVAQHELDQIEAARLKAADESKSAARAQVLERLGLTAEEAALLLG